MTRPLRILHVICTDEFAGVEQFVLRLAVAQATSGHEVAVAGGDPERMRPELARAGIAHAGVATPAAAARAIRARSARTDVINTHMTAADAAACSVVMGRASAPALVSTRHFAKPRGRIAPLDLVFARWIDADIAISEFVARATGTASTVVHPGIAPQSRTTRTPSGRTVLMAQRLQPEKHSAIGVRAFAASGLAARGWTLCIAGDGPDRPTMQKIAEELGVSRHVDFLGYRSDVHILMEKSSILLATCPIEGFGLSVLEAMSRGLAVVAPSVGGPAEMLAGLDDRALFEPDDPEAAGAHLRALAEDDAGRLRYGESAQLRQRQAFTLESQAEQTDAVYRESITTRMSRRRR